MAAKTAEVLGLPHLDTGATYRAATVAALVGSRPIRRAAVLAAVSGFPIRFEAGQVWLDGDDIASDTWCPEVAAAVSPVSAHPEVPPIIVELQQASVVDTAVTPWWKVATSGP